MQQQDQTPELGKIITDGENRRDAIHVAVAPVVADSDLGPGQHVGFLAVDSSGDYRFGPSDNPIGVVDPFLTERVSTGQRFWLCLYPRSIVSLRHAWTHPVFTKAAELLRGVLR